MQVEHPASRAASPAPPQTFELQGSWEGTLVHTDLPDYPVLPVRYAFFADGNLLATHQLYQSPTLLGGAALASPAMGMWTRTSELAGKVMFTMDVWGVNGPKDGVALAKETVTWDFTYDAEEGALNGPFATKLFDPQTGKLLMQTAGTMHVRPANRPESLL